MECKSCGAQIDDNSIQCTYCSAPVPGRSPDLARPVPPASNAGSAARSLGTGSKLFKVYSKGAQTFAVKQGWSWPAFCFSWIWAFTKSLNLAGVIALLVFIFVGALNSGKPEPTSGDTVLSLFCLATIIIFGAKGNQWWENQLVKNAFLLRGEIKANNPTEALAQVS